MADDAQQKTLPATPRKIQKAREEGQVARSRDLGHFAAMAAGGALLVGLASPLTALMSDLMGQAPRPVITLETATAHVFGMPWGGCFFAFAKAPFWKRSNLSLSFAISVRVKPQHVYIRPIILSSLAASVRV